MIFIDTAEAEAAPTDPNPLSNTGTLPRCCVQSRPSKYVWYMYSTLARASNLNPRFPGLEVPKGLGYRTYFRLIATKAVNVDMW